MEDIIVVLNFKDPNYAHIIGLAANEYCCMANGLMRYHESVWDKEKIQQTYLDLVKIKNYIASVIIGKHLIGGAYSFNLQNNSFYEKSKQIAIGLVEDIAIYTESRFKEITENTKFINCLVLKVFNNELLYHVY